MKMTSVTQIRSGMSLKWELCNDMTSSSIEGKQLNLCKGNIIFCHVDCFSVQEKSKVEPEVFCVPSTEATASAMIDSQN